MKELKIRRSTKLIDLIIKCSYDTKKLSVINILARKI